MYFWKKCQKPEGWRVKISKTLDKTVHFNALGGMIEAKFWVFMLEFIWYLCWNPVHVPLFQQTKNFIAFLGNSLSSYYLIYIHLMFNPFFL